MYTTEIFLIDEKKQIGPAFFSGDHSEYTTLKSARLAAKKWAESLGYQINEFRIISSIVGCL